MQLSTLSVSKSCEFAMRGIPCDVHHPSCPFFGTFLLTLDSNLRVLSLDMSAKALGSFFMSSIYFKGIPNFQELRLTFAARDSGPFYRDPKAAFASIPSFINKLSGIFRSLSITANGYVEISYFFSSLGHFPHLIELSVRLSAPPRSPTPLE